MKTAVVTGADRNIGLELCRELLKNGWRVFAGKYLKDLFLLEELQKEYPHALELLPLDCSSLESVRAAAAVVAKRPDGLDMLIHNAAAFGGRGGDIGGEYDFTAFTTAYDVNALGAMRLVECFAPLMEQSEMKRLCFISSEAGAVSVSHRAELSGYGMSKTALNMALRILFNDLQPKGYTFRLYHPGWVRSPKIDRAGQPIPELHGGKFDPWETAQSAIPQFMENRTWEDRMVLIDNEGAAWPF